MKILVVLVSIAPLLTAASDPTLSLPTVNTIEYLEDRSSTTINDFLEDSFLLRAKHGYSRRFTNSEDKKALHDLAKKTSESLQSIAERQRAVKQQIEDYDSDNWDASYGTTGLWRKVSQNINTTILSKSHADLYLALTVDQPEKNKILFRAISELNSLSQVNVAIMKGKMLAQLTALQPSYQPLAIIEFDKFMVDSSVINPTTAALEKIKLIGESEPNELNILLKRLDDNRSNRNDNRSKRHLELVLQLSFLQREHNSADFEKTIQTFPKIKSLVATVALSQLYDSQPASEELQKTTTYEATLAALAGLSDKTKDYQKLFEAISAIEKFQTPLILYVTAVKSAQTSPAKAIDLLIRAAELQQDQKSEHLEIAPEKIAGQAAELAYRLFTESRDNCHLATKTFEYYKNLTGPKMDHSLQYKHAAILEGCGKNIKANALLEKIAANPKNRWKNKAEFELISNAIQKKQYQTLDDKAHLLENFSSLIYDNNDCQYAATAIQLISEIVDQLDELKETASDFPALIDNCKTIANLCRDCIDSDSAALISAEISIFAANKDKDELSRIEKMLNQLNPANSSDNIDILRCRARLLGEQGRFDLAAGAWAKLSDSLKRQLPPSSEPNPNWWRAKFYQLDYYHKSNPAEGPAIAHTLEVLQASFTDISPFWNRRLNSLKKIVQ